MNKHLGILLIAFSLIYLSTSHCLAVADQEGPKIGDVPPALKLTKTLQGPAATELTWDKLKGKVVVLEFWATWCGPCVQAIPHVNDLVEQFKDKPVVFISVTSENEDVVRNFLKTRPIKAYVGIDDYEVLNKAFRVQGIPHALIVDATGHIAAISHPAAIEPENLDEVLAGKKCSLPAPEVYTVDKSSQTVPLNEAPALYEISIREHKMPAKIMGPICMWSHDTNGFEGEIATVESGLHAVFDKSDCRMIVHCKLPEGYYDFKLRAAPGQKNDLRDAFIHALRTTFQLDVKQFTKNMPVYILTQVNTNAPGLRRVEKPGGGGQMRGGFRSSGSDMKGVARDLETALNKPVFDETGLTGYFSVDIKWKLSEAKEPKPIVNGSVTNTINKNSEGDSTSTTISALPMEHLKGLLEKPMRPDLESVVTAARERLGLQLTPAQRPVEILEVSAAK